VQVYKKPITAAQVRALKELYFRWEPGALFEMKVEMAHMYPDGDWPSGMQGLRHLGLLERSKEIDGVFYALTELAKKWIEDPDVEIDTMYCSYNGKPIVNIEEGPGQGQVVTSNRLSFGEVVAVFNLEETLNADHDKHEHGSIENGV
jgi:hypothetical protein